MIHDSLCYELGSVSFQRKIRIGWMEIVLDLYGPDGLSDIWAPFQR